MRKRFRWLTTLVGVGVLSLTVLPQTAGAETQDLIDPSGFPTGGSANPDIFGTAHTIRYFGSTRYNTNLTTAMAHDAENDDFPFDVADRTDGNNTDAIDAAGTFWGAAGCSYSVIVAPGDVPFDALAAASLSDPTDNSEEPFLKRVAAEDPSSNPIGGFGFVDTDTAPIVLTKSGREGATALSPAAREAVQYHSDDDFGCAYQAILMGGPLAVPPGVADEIIGLGYDEVFRVDGTTRFDTARDTAMALGTEFDGGMCSDMSAFDGDTDTDFYENSVVEFRPDGDTCTLLNRSVVLADGGTGADAMAAGYWTSYFQVPMLFTNADGTLPAETLEGLEALDVDNLIVLGGTGRIPAASVTQAATAASATPVTIAGGTRYHTSVLMAQFIGGYWAQGLGDDVDEDVFCLAAHGGDGATATGWPDALGVGPLCAATSPDDTDPHAPDRQFPPVNGADPYTGGGDEQAHELPAVLLTAPGSSSLPSEVEKFLMGDPTATPPTPGLFPETPGDGTWCTSSNGSTCSWDPAFGIVAGGPGVIPDAAMREFATALSGGTYTDFGDHMSPTIDPGFFTKLDLSTVFTDIGDGGANRACFDRGGIADTLRLAVYDNAGLTEFDAEGNVVNDNDDVYLNDNDGTVRAAPTVSSAPTCVSFADDGVAQLPEDAISHALALSLSGHASDAQTFDYSPTKLTTMSGAVGPSGPAIPAASGGGLASELDPDASTVPDATTTWTFGGTSTSAATTITVRGQTAPIASVAVSYSLTRGNDTGLITAPDVMTGTFVITTAVGTVTGTFTGEAIFTGGTWEVRGMTSITGGTFSSASVTVVPATGGFTSTITVNGAGTADDTMTFQLDGIDD